MGVVVELCGGAVVIHSRSVSYVIADDVEYICVSIGKYVNCVTINHGKGTIEHEVYVFEGEEIVDARRRVYRTTSRRGRELLREFELLAEIMLDGAAVTSTTRR